MTDSPSSLYTAWLDAMPALFRALVPASGVAAATPQANGAEPAALPFPADQVGRAMNVADGLLTQLYQAWLPLLAKGELSAEPLQALATSASEMLQKALDAMRVSTAGLPGLPAMAGMPDFNSLAQPWAAMSQAWLPGLGGLGGLSGGSKAPSPLQIGIERSLGGLGDAFGLRPMRELEQAFAEMLSANVGKQRAQLEYLALVAKGFNEGTQGLVKDLAAMGARGERVESLLAFIRLWAKSVDGPIHDAMQSDEGLAITARVLRAATRHRQQVQKAVGLASEALQVPTRADVDEAYREIQELKREMRRLKKSLPSAAKTPVVAEAVAPAPAPAPPAAAAKKKPAAKATRKTAAKSAPRGRTQEPQVMSNPAPALPIHITPQAAFAELASLQRKFAAGAQRLGAFTEDDLAIATTPADEVYREDMMRLYRCRPTAEKLTGQCVLIVYALVGRYQMIDLETDRSFVRKLLAEGIDVYYIDWGHPTRAQRFLTIDDYVSGYLDNCVDLIREREGIDKINLVGICQGGVFSTCYAALFPEKVARLVLTVTPIDFHGDAAAPPVRGSGYMNLWARALDPADIDALVDTLGNSPGPLVGFSFLMMNPVANLAKYSIELLDILDDDKKLLGFLRMERWIADRPSNPGEVVRQWFKDLYQGNKLVKNELVLGGRTVDLRNITMPVLNVYAEGDVVIPNSCSQGMQGHFGTDDYTELGVPGGHIGTFVGGKAQKVLAPSIMKWLAGGKL